MSERGSSWSFRPALQLMAGRAVGFVATFVVPLFLVRVFEPELFGTYKQLFLIYTTLFSLGQIGMAESLFFFLARKPEKAGSYSANSTLLLLASGGVLFVVLTLGRERIAAWMSNPSLAGYLPWIGLYLLLMLGAAGLEISLLCRDRYRTATAIYVASDVMRAAAMTLPVLLLGSLEWLLAAAVAFAALRFAAHLFLLLGWLGRSLRPRAASLRDQLAYSMPFQASVIVEIAQANLHLFAVSRWFGPASFAVYSVGCLQIPLVEIAASSAGNVLMVGMGKAVEGGDLAEARRIWRDTTRKLALMLVPATTLLLLVAGDLIPFLFTAEYAGAVPVFMIWTAAVVLGVVQMDAALRVFAEIRFLLLVNVVRLAAIGALLAVSVSALGMVGAVATTVFALALGKAIGLARLRSRLETGWRGILPWGALGRITAVSAVAALPVLLLQPRLEDATFATLAVLGTVYALAWLALTIATGLLEESEIPSFARPLWRSFAAPASPTPSETP